ncbi:MAG: PDZ domain-containing protein [Bacteroidales bacterium]|nr:PDZ domain-containing protein [Bacteroidales bacterium]
MGRKNASPILWMVVLGLFIGFFVSVVTENIYLKKRPQVIAASKFDEVMYYINNMYVDTVKASELEDEAVAALMDELDPHSQYISLEEFNTVNDPLLGGFEGIGVQFRIVEDTVAIVNTIKGGPSEKVGIMAGDRIVYVNDSLIAGVKIKNDKVMRLLKGPKGTKVKVKNYRRGVEGLLDFTITRDVIPTYSIDIAYMLDDETGYIKLSKFSATTHQEFVVAVKKLKDAGMKQLVFDLRGNGGGYLNEAVDIADEFLPKGSLVVFTEGRVRPKSAFFARRKGLLEDMPVVVLIDGESASASEIVAGAMQDHDRATIIGRRSFGKGLVQEQIMLSDKSAIRITVAKYYTPTGRCIQKPFSGSKKDYMLESYDRYENGELFSADSIHFADSLKYYTPKGKVVYGGGGIMPDVYVPLVNDSTEYFFNRMVNLGILYQYAFDYCDSHRRELARYKTVADFEKSFHITDAMFNELVDQAVKKGLKANEKEKQVARKEANILLKAYIARDLFDDEGFYPIYREMDDVLQKALEVLYSEKKSEISSHSI